MTILNTIYWDISPEFFQISLDFLGLGSISIRYYGLLFATGFLISIYLVQRFYKDSGLDPVEVDKLTIYTVSGTILGARLGHVLFYEPEAYLSNPLEILKVWHGGLASHGGAFGILVSTFLYSRKYKRPYLWVLDRIAIPTALTGGLIRIGNLMNSEIYGRETDLPWGFIFAQNGETSPMHPTQIYEASAYFILFILLHRTYVRAKGKLHRGKILGLFLIGVFGFRFFIEFIKNDQVVREAEMAINIGQWLSIPLVITGIILVYLAPKQKIDYFKN